MVIREVDCAPLLALRRSVLRPGRPLAETQYAGDDAPSTFHLAAYDGELLVGCATGLAETAPGAQPPAYRLRGMAVLEPYRNQGLGATLLEAFDQRAIARGVHEAWCNGRVSAGAFYERHGWVAAGEPFDIIGIPHRVFTKALAR